MADVAEEDQVIADCSSLVVAASIGAIARLRVRQNAFLVLKQLHC